MTSTIVNETELIQGSAVKEVLRAEQLRCISPFRESRQDSYKTMEEENTSQELESEQPKKSLLETIEKNECRELPPQQKVRFKSSRAPGSPTPEIDKTVNTPKLEIPRPVSDRSLDQLRVSGDRTLDLPKPSIRAVAGDGAILETRNKRQSVFERLARTETVAFIHQKFQHVARPKRSTSAPPSIHRTSFGKLTKNRDMNISNHSSPKPRSSSQLPKKDFMNISSHSSPKPRTSTHRLTRKQSIPSIHRKYRRPSLNKILSERAGVEGVDKISELFKRSNSYQVSENNWAPRRKNSFERSKTKTVKSSVGDSFYSRRRSKDEATDVFVGSVEVPLYIEFSNRTKIICSNKYAPELGFDDVDPQQLGIKRSLTEYEAGSLTAKNLASEIMNALLWRDLPKGLKWNINYPLERELAMPIGELGYSFFIEATEEKECEGDNAIIEKNHTASATGNVSFLPDRWEIHIENYSCVHDADRNRTDEV